MTNKSASSQIIEWMKTNLTTVGLDQETITFTSKHIAEKMGLDDDGPVTGLMSRLKHMGFVKEVGRNGRASVYELVGDLSKYYTRKNASAGGSTGRHTTGVTRKQRLINSLLSLTSEIELMKGDLSDFSTKELLHELEKRTQPKE